MLSGSTKTSILPSSFFISVKSLYFENESTIIFSLISIIAQFFWYVSKILIFILFFREYSKSLETSAVVNASVSKFLESYFLYRHCRSKIRPKPGRPSSPTVNPVRRLRPMCIPARLPTRLNSQIRARPAAERARSRPSAPICRRRRNSPAAPATRQTASGALMRPPPPPGAPVPSDSGPDRGTGSAGR